MLLYLVFCNIQWRRTEMENLDSFSSLSFKSDLIYHCWHFTETFRCRLKVFLYFQMHMAVAKTQVSTFLNDTALNALI